VSKSEDNVIIFFSNTLISIQNILSYRYFYLDQQILPV